MDNHNLLFIFGVPEYREVHVSEYIAYKHTIIVPGMESRRLTGLHDISIMYSSTRTGEVVVICLHICARTTAAQDYCRRGRCDTEMIHVLLILFPPLYSHYLIRFVVGVEQVLCAVNLHCVLLLYVLCVLFLFHDLSIFFLCDKYNKPVGITKLWR